MMIELLLAAVGLLLLVVTTHKLSHQSRRVSIEEINALLPQTQCGRCGFAGCKNYAQALLHGKAKSNLCPPGGYAVKLALEAKLPNSSTIERLNSTVNQTTLPKAEHQTIPEAIPVINLTNYANHKPTTTQLDEPLDKPQIAMIDADMCIGCVLCVTQCPTGAIIGTRGSSHHVTEHLCTGCDLCVDICPTTCIKMVTDLDNARDAMNWSVEQQKTVDRRRYEELWKFESAARKPLHNKMKQPLQQQSTKNNNVQLRIAKAALKQFMDQNASLQQINTMKAQIAKLENS